MYSFSENNTFDIILNRLLSRVNDKFDKREGSIIYDALAPAAAELAQCYIALDIYANQTYLLNAVQENLDNRVADYGLTRIAATPAHVIIKVLDTNNNLMSVDIGTRFAIPNEYGGYTFTIISNISSGYYLAECETVGTVGNRYIGDVLPVQGVNNLGSATITAIEKNGEDEETDDDLRERAVRKLNNTAFAGNKIAYRELVTDIDGSTDCRVFPAWQGGGTVKLAIIAAGHSIPSQEFINDLQEQIDPIANSGEGIGLAPIGHRVTVVAPTQLTINVTATIELQDRVTIESVRSAIEEQIEEYLYTVQNDFLEKDKLTIYLSKISAAILNVNAVKNVSSVAINGDAEDLEIDLQNGLNVQYPILGKPVTLYEST